jgi:hypothetical protein
MADDRMKHDDLNPGGGKQAGQQGQGGQGGNQPGQQSPGRNPQDDEKFGQRSGGQGTGNRGLEDDELDKGSNIGGQQGDQGRQNR